MAEITRGGARRNAKLASLPLGVAGRAATGFGRRLAGGDRDEIAADMLEKTAEQLFAVLGELKGGAMKVGQALSIMEAAIPEEFGEPFREALTKLQAEAPPLPAAKVHGVLDNQLGTKWRDRFQEFSDEPAASASIGQVHKAVWHDGRDVAVKVQYPGADGRITDWRALADAAHEVGALVTAAADLLALTLLTPPGEWGADVAVGSSQRFGVPMGFGGPHAAYMAVRDEF